MKHAACVLALRGDGAVLAVSRPNPPLRFGLPGGRVESGETHVQAAARELHEETGYVAIGLKPLYEAVSGDTHTMTFLVRGVCGQLRSSEEGWARWVDPRVVVCPGAAYPAYTRAVFTAAGLPRPNC